MECANQEHKEDWVMKGQWLASCVFANDVHTLYFQAQMEAASIPVDVDVGRSAHHKK